MSTDWKEYDIAAENELRCEVKESHVLSVRLVKGDAECFGVELALNKIYKFSDQNMAIFSWYGCKLEFFLTNIEDSTKLHDDYYCADSTPMIAYVNTHAQLEARRDVAVNNDDSGPRVLILGSEDSGKSSVARILYSYAARLDRTPIYVDLDLGESGFGGTPGSVVAVPVEKSMLSVTEGLSSPLTPLVYFVGAMSVKDSPDVFHHHISLLANGIKKRLSIDRETKTSGVIINTGKDLTHIDQANENVLANIIQEFEVDVILVMDKTGDKIFNKLCKLQTSGIIPATSTIVKLPSSKGIVVRDQSTRERIRKIRIDEYFYGLKVLRGTSNGLKPHKISLSLSKLIFLRTNNIQIASELMPISSAQAKHQEKVRLSVVRPTGDLCSQIVAVLHVPTVEIDSTDINIPLGLINSNVGGFMHIIDIDVDADIITCLTPCPTSIETLPSKYVVTGNVNYSD
jgi:polyribonucleotide 5'-hydroxyl-kinase